MSEFSDFILTHENDDIATLLLSKTTPPEGFDIATVADTIRTRRKFRTKVPSWYACPDLVLAPALSGEQSSSEITAAYKANLALRLFSDLWSNSSDDSALSFRSNSIPVPDTNPGPPPSYSHSALHVADLTGGLGVDSWAFSKVASQVLYNEMSSQLAQIAERNFALLGAYNIKVKSGMLMSEDGASAEAAGDVGQSAEGDAPGMTVNEILGDFCPDVIFLDPARRDGAGRKVFLMEDCSPDVLKLKDELLSKARFLMLKLSPMADIDMVVDRLGPQCREVHSIETGGDCRELLVVMDRDWAGECSYVAATERGSSAFSAAERKASSAVFPATASELRDGMLLFEPGKALMKIGAFNCICSRYGLVKLGKSTHYYVLHADLKTHATERHSPASGTSEEGFTELSDLGKFFEIKEILPLSKEGIRTAARNWPGAAVTARNLPLDTADLEKKIGACATKNRDAASRIGVATKEIGPNDSEAHIFALRCDFTAAKSSNILLVTVRA